MVDPNTKAMLDWFGGYFKAHEDHLLVDPAALLTFIRLRLSNPDPDLMRMFEIIVARLGEPLDETTLRTTIQTLEELRLSGEAAALVTRYQAGEEVDLAFELQALAHRTKERIERTSSAAWADQDPLVYLRNAADDSGIPWTVLPQLQSALKGLRAGLNIGVAAPTDVGKTSWLCRLAISFAKAARDSMYADRPVLYLLNESNAEAVTPRLYQSAIKADLRTTLKYAEDGTLTDRYVRVVGRRDAVRCVNIHQMRLSQVSRIIEAHHPWLVITDMTGRITANSNPGGGKNDVGQVEEVWNTIRELATIQDFAHIGTIQVSAEGFGLLYPPLSALQDSKVGIQTTLDMCIMIGRLLDAPNCDMLRGISLPKNKLARSGVPAYQKLQAMFNPDTNEWDSGIDFPQNAGA
jgi:hypothetical protein